MERSGALVPRLRRHRRIHRVLVVQRGHLVGIVTTLDVLRAIATAK